MNRLFLSPYKHCLYVFVFFAHLERKCSYKNEGKKREMQQYNIL